MKLNLREWVEYTVLMAAVTGFGGAIAVYSLIEQDTVTFFFGTLTAFLGAAFVFS